MTTISRRMPIAETPDVRLPVMICQDGFITSHAVENIRAVEDDEVQGLCGGISSGELPVKARQSRWRWAPTARAPLLYGGTKWQQAEAMKNAKQAILDRGKRILSAPSARTLRLLRGIPDGGRRGSPGAHRFRTAGTAKRCRGSAARRRARRSGLIKLRVFRPFPAEELAAGAGPLSRLWLCMDKSRGL